MLLWRCYLTPHPTITVQFVMTQALASQLMVMGIGLPMVAGASPMLGASLQYTITHYSSLSTDSNIPLGFNTTARTQILLYSNSKPLETTATTLWTRGLSMVIGYGTFHAFNGEK